MSHDVDLQIIGGNVNLYKITHKKYFKKISWKIKKKINFVRSGEMAEWSIAAVLKTVEP
jgi:hypothetical protein